MSALAVRKDRRWWRIVITAGPSTGTELGFTFDRRRDAEARIAELDGQPWEHLHVSIADAVASTTTIVTVPRTNLESMVWRAALSDEELAMYRSVCLVHECDSLHRALNEAAMAMRSGS